MDNQNNTGLQLIYVTIPDEAAARALAEQLVTARLVACVNILPGMISVYCWQGAIETAREVVMIAKTVRARTHEVIDFICRHHPYDCPAIMGIPITDAPAAFQTWVSKEVSWHYTSISKKK